MQQETYQGSDPLRQFFQWNETMWADMQRASLGDNPVTRALSEVNAQDLNTFYNAVANNPVPGRRPSPSARRKRLPPCLESTLKFP